MISEWLKVMLEEVSRKKADAERARAEGRLRAEEAARTDDKPSAKDRAQG